MNHAPPPALSRPPSRTQTAPRRPNRRILVVVAALAVLSSSACRDQRPTSGGPRLGDRDVLGGRALTAAEVEAGFYVSSDAELNAFATHFADTVGGSLQLFGNLTASGTGVLSDFNATTGTFFRPPPGTLYSFPVGQLRDEYVALCSDPLLGDQFPKYGPTSDPCNFLHMPQIFHDVFDDVTVTLRSAEATARWVSPSRRLSCEVRTTNESDDPGTCAAGCKSGFQCDAATDTCVYRVQPCTNNGQCNTSLDSGGGVCDATREQCTQIVWDHCFGDAHEDAPVIEVRIPADIHTDPDEGFGALTATVLIHSADIVIRLQAQACADGWCRDGRTVFEGFRALAGGDVGFTDVDLHVTAATTAENVEIEVIPGWGMASSCIAGDYAGCAGLDWLLRQEATGAVTRIARRFGGTMDYFMSAPALPPVALSRSRLDTVLSSIPGASAVSNAVRDQVAAHASLDVAGLLVRLPDGTTAPLGGSGGAWTNHTVRSLAFGGEVVGATVNMNAFTAVCGADFEAMCTSAATPDPRCVVCDACDDFAGLSSTLDRVCAFGVVELSDPTSTTSFFTIPAAPALASLLAGTTNTAVELRRVFSRPLDDFARRTGRPTPRVTAAAFCAETSGLRADDCLDGVITPALFRIIADADRDGDPDHADNCRGVTNPDQADGDGDGLGDACDGCPGVAATSNADRDGDGTPNACDCDADGDFCNNPVIGVDGVDRCVPGEGGFFDEDPLLADCERFLPGRVCVPQHTDDDGIPDDCDPDNDDDGVPDEDDNCPVHANADQADENDNGLGDACDLLCAGAGAPFCLHSPGEIGVSPFEPIPELRGLMGSIDGWRIFRGCLVDGPGCGTWWSFLEDILVMRAGTGAIAGTFKPDELGFSGFGLDGFGLKDLDGPPPNALLPDLDGDALPELALGAPGAFSGRGALVIVASSTGTPLLTLEGQGAHDGFGSALAVVGSLLHVGVPGAHDVLGKATGAVLQIDVVTMMSLDAFYGDESEGAFGGTIVPISRPAQGGAAPYEIVVGAPGAGLAYGLDIHGIRRTVFDGNGTPGFGGVIADAGAFFAGAVLFGAPAAESGKGTVGLYDESGHPKWIVEGEPGAKLGASLVGPVDYNGLGAFAAMAGAPGHKQNRGVVLGLSASGAVGVMAEGGAGARVGASLLSPGDLTGDGRPDLVVGARGLLNDGALLLFPGASPLVAPPVAGSCLDRCGGVGHDGTCSCDAQCEQYGDCCVDRDAFCPGGAAPAGSCDGACGGASPDGCYCDALCEQYGDCCGDFAGFCAEPRCAEVTGSCDVTLENGWATCACDDECALRGDCCADADTCG